MLKHESFFFGKIRLEFLSDLCNSEKILLTYRAVDNEVVYNIHKRKIRWEEGRDATAEIADFAT